VLQPQVPLSSGKIGPRASAACPFTLASLRKWEQGVRKPDAATRAYLTLIARNPKVVADTLSAA
jgi:hypothetical protein